MSIQQPSPRNFTNLAWLLTGPEKAHHKFEQPLKAINEQIESFEKRTGSAPHPWHTLSLKKWLLNMRKNIRSQFLNYDFHDFTYYKRLNTTFGNPPIGALILFAYVGLEVARALRAWNRRWIKDSQGRKVKQDFREVRDVLIRDTWAITVYLWGLGIANKYFINKAQQTTGFKLANASGNPYDFTTHEVHRDFRNIDPETGKPGNFRRRTYIANILHGNGEGMVQAAMDNTLFGIPREIFHRASTASASVKEKLVRVGELISEFRNEQKNVYKALERYVPTKFEKNVNFETRIQKAVDKHGDKVYELLDSKGGKPGLLRQLDDLQHAIIQELSTKPNGQANTKLATQLEKNWGRFSEFFVRAAKNKRTGIDALSFVFILFLIGYLPVKFNEWFTNKEYEKMQADQRRYLGMAMTLNNTHTPLHPQHYDKRAQQFGMA